MSVSIMPAPRDGFSEPTVQAILNTGILFYTKEITVEDGYQTTNGHLKMTFGLFGKFSAVDRIFYPDITEVNQFTTKVR